VSTLSTVEPNFRSAIKAVVTSLRGVASYELETPLAHRMQDLSERKEFLNTEEHDELLALVDFSQRRTIEKLEAQVALRRLGEIIPELVTLP
jgi:hypothetical protein